MTHVLVVDDEEAVVYIFRKYLEGAGFQVSAAGNAAEAIAIFNAGGIDALVTDLRMPGMPGDALIAHLRQMAPSLPAVVVSAYATQASLAVSDVRVLDKPVSASGFVSAVQEALEQARR